MGLLGFLAGLFLLLGDHRLEDEAVVLLIEAMLDLVAYAVQLGLATDRDLAEKAGSWLAMIQLAARSSAWPATAARGPL